MRIEKNGSGELVIYENIKSIDDYLKISGEIGDLVEGGAGELQLWVPESISMPSSVLGLLLKLKNQDGVHLSVRVGDRRLYELLDELNLIEELNVAIGH